MEVIIYTKDGTDINIITPASECLLFANMQEIATKDVPSGCKFKIINKDFIPNDRTFRSAWEWNKDWTHDGIGGKNNKFEKDVIERYLKLKGQE